MGDPKPLKIEQVDVSGTTSVGLRGGGGVVGPLPTTVSESGIGGDVRVDVSSCEGVQKCHVCSFEYNYQDTTGHIGTDTDASGSGAPRTMHAVKFGCGSRKRFSTWVDKVTLKRSGAAIQEAIPYVRFGTSKYDKRTANVKGEEVTVPGTEPDDFLELGGETTFGIEWRPTGNRFQVTFVPLKLVTGYRFGGENSPNNRLVIEIGIAVYVGYGDDAGSANPKITGWDLVQLAYKKIHGFLRGLQAERVIGGPQNIINESGVLGDGGGEGDSGSKPPNMTEDVSLLSAVSAFMAAGGGSISVFTNTDGAAKFIVAGLDAISGIASYATAKTNGGKANGIGDFSKVADMILYSAFHGIDIKGSVASAKNPTGAVAKVLATQFATRMALLIGGVSAGDSDAGDILRGASVGSFMSWDLDPLGMFDKRTTYGYIPFTSEERAGIFIHTSYLDLSVAKNFNAFTEVRLLSPMLTLSNLFRRIGQNERYANDYVANSVEWTGGLEYTLDEELFVMRIGAGIDLSKFSGGEHDTGIGGAIMATMGFKIAKAVELNVWGMFAGRAMMGGKRGTGEHYEGAFGIGFGLIPKVNEIEDR